MNSLPCYRENREKTRAGRWLALIIGLYLLLGVAYSLIVPLGEAPDEIDHILYVRYLIETRAFPVMQPAAADNATMEANQPPLYYLLEAALTAPFPMTETADFPPNTCYTFTPGEGRANFYLHSPAEASFLSETYRAFRIARLISLLLGAVTVGLAYRLGRQMAPQRPFVALLSAAVLAFNPQFLFMSASVNNDVLMALLGAAIVYVSIQAVIQPARWRFPLLGALVGLALLTKFALLALWPLALLAAITHPLRPTQYAIRNTFSSLITNLLFVLLLPLLIAGGWYWRANALYGDPLAWGIHLQAKGDQVLRTTPFTLRDLAEFGRIHFQSYWGWFGWLKIQLPGWAYGLLLLMVLAAVAGLFLQVKGWKWSPKRPFLPQAHQIALIFNLLAVTAVYLSLLRYIQTINWSGYQGRLAYGVAAPIAPLLALGLARILRNTHYALRLLPPIFLFLLATGSLLFLLRPSFPRPQIFQPDAALPRVCADLPGVQVETAVYPPAVKPGERLPLELGLVGLETAESRPLQVRVVAYDGRILGQAEAELAWEKGDVWSSRLALPIAADAEPTGAVVQAGVAGEVRDVGRVKIAPRRPFRPQPQYPVKDADFEGQLALIGYDLNRDGTITLYWQALAGMEEDYTTFIHLLGANGELLAQADSQPGNGRYPTSIWDEGEIVADAKEWPASGEEGQLLVGVYLLETGRRLLLPGGGDAYPLNSP